MHKLVLISSKQFLLISGFNGNNYKDKYMIFIFSDVSRQSGRDEMGFSLVFFSVLRCFSFYHFRSF